MVARALPPHFVGPDSACYPSVNRNKRSVAASDVVMENFRPGVLARLGLACEKLAAERPKPIWCSIGGFGQDGPDRDRPACDVVVQALSGGMSMTGEPGRPAVRAGIPVGRINTLAEALADPQAVHRGMVLELADGGATVRVAGNPIRFPGAPHPPCAWPPALGADTRAVLDGVPGMGAAEIDAALAAGIGHAPGGAAENGRQREEGGA